MQNNQMAGAPQMKNSNQIYPDNLNNDSLAKNIINYLTTEDLHSYKGEERLKNLKSFSVVSKRVSGYSDIFCCKYFGNNFEITELNPSRQMQEQPPLFIVNLKDPGCCQSDIEGQFSSINKVQGQALQDEQLYDIGHNRSCCFLKCIISSLFFFLSFIPFYCMAMCCTSSGKVSKNGVLQRKLDYACCLKKINIKEPEGKVKYVLKGGLFDPNGKEIYGFKCDPQTETFESGSGRNRRVQTVIVGANVVLPDGISAEDKVAIILGICKSIS